jgi:hypothetical protein
VDPVDEELSSDVGGAEGDAVLVGGAKVVTSAGGRDIGVVVGEMVGKVEITLWIMLDKGVAWSKARQ